MTPILPVLTVLLIIIAWMALLWSSIRHHAQRFVALQENDLPKKSEALLRSHTLLVRRSALRYLQAKQLADFLGWSISSRPEAPGYLHSWLLASLSPARLAAALRACDLPTRRRVISILSEELKPRKLAAVLLLLTPHFLLPVLDGIPNLLSVLSNRKAMMLVEAASTPEAVELINHFPLGKQVALMERLMPANAAEILTVMEQVRPYVWTRIKAQMSNAKLADILIAKDLKEKKMGQKIQSLWNRTLPITQAFTRIITTQICKSCIIGLILVWLGFFWMPNKGAGSLLIILSALTGWIGIVMAGRINLFATEVGRNLKTGLKGKNAIPAAQQGRMNLGSILVTYIDPLIAGGVGYPLANWLVSIIGLPFGFVPGFQALISDVTGLPRCLVLYQHVRERQTTFGSVVRACLTLIIVGVAAVGMFVPYGTVDRGIQFFAGLAVLNTAVQFFFPAVVWKVRNKEGLNARFWIGNLATMLPVTLGIAASAVIGVIVGTLVQSSFMTIYPKATYGHMGMYKFTANYVGTTAQEAVQLIIGGIGIQLLLNRLGGQFFQIWFILLRVGFAKLGRMLLGLITFSWVRAFIRTLRRNKQQTPRQRH